MAFTRVLGQSAHTPGAEEWEEVPYEEALAVGEEPAAQCDADVFGAVYAEEESCSTSSTLALLDGLLSKYTQNMAGLGRKGRKAPHLETWLLSL